MNKFSVNQGKASSSSSSPPSSSSKQKQAKSKKKPVKVVYIANPVKVKTSASDFRALVQQLTGQDSTVADASPYSVVNDQDGVAQQIPRVVDPYREAIRTFDSTFEFFQPFDQVYTPCLIDNYNALTLSTGLLYDVPQTKP